MDILSRRTTSISRQRERAVLELLDTKVHVKEYVMERFCTERRYNGAQRLGADPKLPHISVRRTLRTYRW